MKVDECQCEDFFGHQFWYNPPNGVTEKQDNCAFFDRYNPRGLQPDDSNLYSDCFTAPNAIPANCIAYRARGDGHPSPTHADLGADGCHRKW